MLRALLILLALCLPLPAAAGPACHDMAMGSAAMPGHQAPADEHRPVVANHLCIGCVPPSDWLRAPVVAPGAGRDVPAPATIRTLDIGRGSPPALPPPRKA